MQPAPLNIVASPRSGVGKTLLARLMMEHFLDNGARWLVRP
jgi:cobyrinic acid a,c-diamide synthase